MSSDGQPLRPLRVRMASAARSVGKPQFVVEKDYALSYLLAGIASIPDLRELLVFKGGTCLRKAYFAGYRFSEDLDFTARQPLACAVLLDGLTAAVDVMASRLLHFGPIEVSVAEELHRAPHPRAQCVFRVRVRFPWMRGLDCSLKVEISTQEPLLADSVERPLIHELPDETLDVAIAAYHLEEIAAEKLRAFLQSRDHGWPRNRPRDLYDLWYLYHQQSESVNWRSVKDLLEGKAAAYGIAFAGPEDLSDERVLAGIQRDWQPQLANFVVDLPSFAECVSTLELAIAAIFG